MYEWLKVFHIISVIAWMAGLLYLPRLMVYHSVATVGLELSENFKIMERRLLKAIMTPAMLFTWFFGLGLAGSLKPWLDPWFMIKIFLVVLMSAFHMVASGWVRKFAEDKNVHSQRYFRIANEVPTVLMIFIVILVVVKPF